MANIQKIERQTALTTTNSGYVRLVTQISELWDGAREQAFNAVNTSLLMANRKTGEYIVEFEQKGEARAKYGDALLVNLSKDLTRLRGRGFSRSALTYMRKFYLAFPKCATVSHKLTWSHYLELLKCDDPLEMQFYFNEAMHFVGAECVFASEWNKYARQSYEANYKAIAPSIFADNNLLFNEDIHDAKPEDIPNFDVC